MTELEKAAKEYASCDIAEGGLTGLCGMDASKYEPFIAGAQWQAKQSPWIDFHHQMPVENQLVLVQAGYRQNVIHLTTYHDGEFYENGKEVNFVGDWMPIPELPKE